LDARESWREGEGENKEDLLFACMQEEKLRDDDLRRLKHMKGEWNTEKEKKQNFI